MKDLRLEPLEKNAKNFEFALACKKEALGPHIIPRWGWDERLQRKTHADRWAARHFSRIILDGAAIGTVSIDEMSDHLVLAEFYIRPPFHRRGIGTEILGRVVAAADSKGLPVKLQVLKWNPARSLYERHGFVTVGETETHFLMERPVAAAHRPGVTVRNAQPEEAPDLSALAMRAKAHWGYSAETLERLRTELAIRSDDVRARPTFVAVLGSRVAGFCSLHPSPAAWELDNLWVEPEFMQRGIGRSLVMHAVEAARCAGAKEIVIDSDPHAEAFYLSCGAVRRGEVAAPIPGEAERIRPQLSLQVTR